MTPSTHQIRDASEQVAAQIQHHIQREGLGPDDFLGREEDLATEFGVSRPTLREALRLLASGNLIRATKGPGGGIFVARTADRGISRSLSDSISMMLETGAVSLEELMEARIALEVPLAGVAASEADATTLERLRRALDEEAGADAAIHLAIAEASGNRLLQALTDWILEVAQPALNEVLRPAMNDAEVLDQHRVLVAAIEAGDPARAERAMKDHLGYLRDALREVRGQ